MNFKNLYHALACAVLLSFASGCGNEAQSQSTRTQRSAEDVIGGMRMKQLTRDLELTDDQQSKVKELLDGEGKEVARIHSQANLSVMEQSTKIGEIKKETYDKIRPLLTPAQLEKLEKALAKPARRKRN